MKTTRKFLPKTQARQSGMGILQTLVAIVIGTIALLAMMSILTRAFRATNSLTIRGDLDSLRWTLLERASCARTLAPYAAGCPNVIDIVDKNGAIVVAGTGTQYGAWTLRGRCTTGVLSIEAARILGAGFAVDPLTKRLQDWTYGKTALFPDELSFCEIDNSRTRDPATFKNRGTFSYTIPRDVQSLMVEIWGAGGGGGGSDGCNINDAGGNGGGAGGYGRGIFNVTPGETYSIIIGAGGAGGGANGVRTQGITGGTTRVLDGSGNEIFAATGGRGGRHSTCQMGCGGEGGAASTGLAVDIASIVGGNGAEGRGCGSITNGSGGIAGGNGFQSNWAGIGPGAGGHGGGTNALGGTPGGVGADGMVVLWLPR